MCKEVEKTNFQKYIGNLVTEEKIELMKEWQLEQDKKALEVVRKQLKDAESDKDSYEYRDDDPIEKIREKARVGRKIRSLKTIIDFSEKYHCMDYGTFGAGYQYIIIPTSIGDEIYIKNLVTEEQFELSDSDCF